MAGCNGQVEGQGPILRPARKRDYCVYTRNFEAPLRARTTVCMCAAAGDTSSTCWMNSPRLRLCAVLDSLFNLCNAQCRTPVPSCIRQRAHHSTAMLVPTTLDTPLDAYLCGIRGCVLLCLH